MCVSVCATSSDLTDRVSTKRSNLCGCQSDTWSVGQENIRGTSTKFQRGFDVIDGLPPTRSPVVTLTPALMLCEFEFRYRFILFIFLTKIK